MRGKLVAFEGLDGAGKRTQLDLAAAKLKDLGVPCATISFPRYGLSLYADLVARYLNGNFGDPVSVSPYLSAIPYALDRFDARGKLQGWLESGQLVLADRYVGSNLAHQAGKLRQDADVFVSWLCKLEYEALKVPKEDLVIYLNIPPQLAFQRVKGKKRRTYTRLSRDIHERDLLYQQSTYQVYESLVRRFDFWTKIDCVSPGGDVLSPEDINEQVVRCIRSLL